MSRYTISGQKYGVVKGRTVGTMRSHLEIRSIVYAKSGETWDE